MAKRLFLNRRSLFYIWLLSYFLILLVPVSIGLVIYLESKRTIETEINRVNAVVLNQVRQAMDNRLLEVEKLSLEIAWTPSLQNLIYVKKPLQEHNRFSIFKTIQSFKIYLVANRFIDTFYVYLKNIDSALTPDARYDGNLLYELLHQYEGMSYKQWRQVVEQVHITSYFPLARRSEDGKILHTIAFATSLPIADPKQALATIMIILDAQCFQRAIDSLQWTNRGEVFILDRENRILSTTRQMSLPESLRFERLPGAEGTFTEDIFNEKAVVSYVQSQVAEWKYVSVIPVRLFLEKAQYIRRLTLISLWVCIALGGLIAYLFSRRNYYPLSKIVQTLAKKGKRPHPDEYNEYVFLQDAISSTLAEKNKMSKELRQQRTILRSNFLMRLLRGKLRGNIPIHEALSSFDIQFQSDDFVVMLFHLEEAVDEERKVRSAQNALTSAMNESVQPLGRCYCVDLEDGSACLINLVGLDDLRSREELAGIARRIQELMGSRFALKLSVSLSRVHKTFAGIPEAYQEAVEAMEYRMVMGSGGIIHFADIMAPEPRYYFPIEVEQQLINCIRAGNCENANGLLREIFQNNFAGAAISIEMARCLLFDLVSTMIKTIDSIDIPAEKTFWEELKPVKALLGCETVDELETQMVNILRQVCDFINKNKKSHNVILRDRIEEYIEQNYSDINLSITMIADHFHMNPSYISRFFKEQEGEGLLDHIKNKRVEQAKELLQDDELNISEVARKVGYFNCNTFIRVFKKHEGTTPGKFKEMRQQGSG